MGRRLHLVPLFLAALVAATSCAPVEAPGGSPAEISGGMPEPGYPGVVAVYNTAIGGLCSGTLIAPRVVLTAKHCVMDQGAPGPSPASAFTILIGPSITAPIATYRVVTVRTTSGPYNTTGQLTNVDVALLTLERAVTEADPIPYRTTSPRDTIGTTAIVIGYGETPAGGAGVKYRGTTRVMSVSVNEIYASGATCHGDSGGPMLDADGAVFGVTSWGAGLCGGGFDAHNGLTTPEIIGLINAALDEGAMCRNDGPEVCDGADNDCDDEVDEGCTPAGAACDPLRDVCAAGLPCAPTPAGTLCVQSCDPLRPGLGCPIGSYCATLDEGACGGGCVPGTAPGPTVAKAVGTSCTTDTECASLFCTDPGDGTRRCLEPCRQDLGMCLSDEACAARVGGCGACVAAGELDGNHGLGETCAADGECASGTCLDDLGVHYCTRACAVDTDCAASFHCRVDDAGAGVCARGRREGIGGSCVTNSDCDEHAPICVQRGTVHWCTPLCDLPDPVTMMPTECSAGFTCTPAPGTGHSVCIPDAHLVGESCVMDAECTSGTCRDGACTRSCSPDSPCAAGTECVRGMDGAASCRVPPAPPTMMMTPPPGGGCSTTGRASDGGALFLFALVLGLVTVRRRRIASLVAATLAMGALALSAAACSQDPVLDVGGTPAAISGGTRETGYPAVVYLTNAPPGSAFGAACTGSIIGPRVVLTARHCVAAFTSSGAPLAHAAPPANFHVYVGPAPEFGMYSEVHAVSEVRVAIDDGRWDINDGGDVAVLLLATPTSVPPMEYATASAGTWTGSTMTAVGYGQLPDGSSGVKYRVMMMNEGIQMRYFIIVDPSICEGDSGGPALMADGKIYGVASFGFSTSGGGMPTCGDSYGAYTIIQPWLTMIETALTDTGTCVAGAETCNGLDDNCDGTIDEGCTAFGGACADASECTSMACEETGSGRHCTQSCSPLHPQIGCPPDYYCARSAGCAGICVPGAGGTKADAEACTANTECASLLCVDPGDGMQRCLSPCAYDGGACAAGEACAAPPGSCGGCVPVAELAPPHGIGEPCSADTDCAGMHCSHVGDTSYCSRACTTADDCVVGYDCRDGFCHRGVPEGTGGPCAGNEDCAAPGVCAALGSRSWCTVVCTADAGCPMGYTCDPAAGTMICVPALSLVGESCHASSECTTGLCELGSGSCTRICDPDSPCPGGFDCRRAGTTSVCLRPAHPMPPSHGGCGVSGRGATSGWLVAPALALIAVLRRKRRRVSR